MPPKKSAVKSEVLEITNEDRIQLLRDTLITTLSIQDWEILYDVRESITTMDGQEALGCIIIFPASLVAHIIVKDGLPLGEAMGIEVHEHVHLTQNEIIAVIQNMHKYAPEPQAGNIEGRLHDAIEPACVRVTRFVSRALGEAFPALAELQQSRGVKAMDEDGVRMRDFICVVKGKRMPADKVLDRVKSGSSRGMVIV